MSTHINFSGKSAALKKPICPGNCHDREVGFLSHGANEYVYKS